MRYFLGVTLALGLMLNIVSMAEAAEYFVAPAPVGSNGNTGTFDQPFATIQHGVDVLRPGDVLNIREGRYVEKVTITKGGTAEQPVTIQAYEDEVVVIDGEYRLPNGRLNEKIPDGIEKGTLRANTDGTYTYIGAPATGQPPEPTVYKQTIGILVDISASYVHLNNITVTRSDGRGIRTQDGAQYNILDGVVIKNTRWHGYADYGEHNTIRNCEVFDSNNFAPFTRPATTKDAPTTGRERGLNWGAAIPQTKDDSEYLTVQNCVIHDNWGEGLIASTGTLVENNVFYNNFSTSVYMEESVDVVIRNNLIYNTGETILRNGARAEGINVTDEQHGVPINSSGGKIYNNIVVGNGGGLVSFTGQLSDIDVYNNSFVNTTKEGRNILLSGSATYDNYRVRNNVVYTSLFDSIARVATDQVSFQSNVWNKQPPAAVMTGANNGSLVVDPKLVNPDAVISILRAAQAIDPVNYGPQAGSPAIGAATGETPERDFFGCLRDGAPDIGAIEFGGTDCDREATPLPTAEPTAEPAGNGWEGVLVWLRNLSGDLKGRLVK